MTESHEDKRKYARLNALVDVSCNRHPLGAGEEPSLQLTRNISPGGICLIVYEEFRKDELLDLKIHLPDEKDSIDVLARVAWVSEFTIGDKIGKRYDMGVEFMKISDADKTKIDQYVFGHM